MVDEDSHSTDLSVSEEGHSTILLAHYIFWFQLRTQLFRNLVTPEQKCQPRPQGAFPWLWGRGGKSQGKAPWGRGCIIQVKFRAEKNLKTCRIFTLPDPGLEIRRGSVIHTLGKGGRRSPKKFFSTLRASVWSRNKRGTQVPRAPPLDPQLI